MTISTVMMIDDNDGDHFLMQTLLEDIDENITMLQAYNGKEALALLDKTDVMPDIIFLDINMPGMNGIDFLEAYSKRENAPAVICMLTSSVQSADKEKGEKYAVVIGYYTKPITADDIVQIGERLAG